MKSSWRSELPQLAIILAMIIVAAASWSNVPESIPVHWNLQGEVDGYGSRFTGLLLLPLVTLGLYLLLRFLPLVDPGKANYEKFATAYNVIRLTILSVMAVIYFASVAAALGHRVDMSLIASLAVGVMFLILGPLMGKIRPNWFVGVRTPWTLSSELSWNKTHRAAAWMMCTWGLLIAATGIVRTAWILAAMVTAIVAGTVGLFVYSYLVFRQDSNRVAPSGAKSNADAKA